MELAPLERLDFDSLIRWTTSPEFLLQWAGPSFSYPLTAEQLDEHCRGCAAEPPLREMWKAVLPRSGEMIGHAELGSIDYAARTATVSRVIIGDPLERGKGFGTTLMQLLLRRAFEGIGLRALDLYVFDFNRRAVDCYARVGFTIDAHMQNVRRVADGYWSMYRMVMQRTGSGSRASAPATPPLPSG
jgi:RimJ/RimL family protein N-acetyltransferase